MQPDTLFIGHEIKILEKADSTNTYALNLVRKTPPPEGYIVWALEQQVGRGQRGNQWLSEPRANLTFSIILHPNFLPVSEQFSLTKSIALGIARFVSAKLNSFSDVNIKWPNDIYVHDSKIAGILIENILEGSFIKHAVVGIGLNVNQTVFDPALPNPTSLKQECRQEFDLDVCLKQLCSFIEKYYLELRLQLSKQEDEEYHQLLYKKGVWSNFMLNTKCFTGKIEGVNKSGHLLILRKNDINNSYEPLEVTDNKQLVFL